jgi:hypothetical protein
LIFGGVINTSAQYQPLFNHSADLAVNSIYDLTLDKRGVLWLATDDGVMGYNGFDFEKLDLDIREVLTCKADSNGGLWGISHHAKFFSYKTEEPGQDPVYQEHADLSTFSGPHEYLNGKMYCGHNDTLAEIDCKTNEVKSFKLLHSSALRCIWEHQGEIYCSNGAYIYKIENGKVIGPLNKRQSALIISCISFQDRIFVLTSTMLTELVDGKLVDIIPQELPNLWSDLVKLEVVDGELYLLKGDQILIFRENRFDKWQQLNSLVSGFIKDEGGNFWTSTTNGELFKFPIYLKNITVSPNICTYPKFLESFKGTGHRRFYGFNDGTVLIDGKVIRYSPRPNSRVIWMDKIGQNYFVGADAGFYKISPDLKVEQLYWAAIKSVQIRDGLVYAGYHNGIRVFDPNVPDEGVDIYKKRVIQMTFDPAGNIWANTMDGLIELHHEGGHFQARAPTTLPNKCLTIHALKDGTLLFLTELQELYHYNPKTEELHLSNQFEQKRIISMQADPFVEDMYYFASNSGIYLYRYYPHYSWELVGYMQTTSDFIGVHPKHMQVTKDSILICNRTKVYSIPKDQIGVKYNSSSPEIYAVNSAFLRHVDGKNYYLKPGKGSVQIEFFDPLHINEFFEYRLKTEEQLGPWTTISGNKLDIIQFPPGLNSIEYRHGISELESTLSIKKISSTNFIQEITLLENTSFKIAMVSLLFMGIIFFIISRTRSALKIKTISLQLEQTKNQSIIHGLRGQMNPHFIRNCLNSILGLMNSNKKEAAANYLVDFSYLLEDFLDQTVSDYTNLSEEITMIERFVNLEQMRLSNNFEFYMDISPDVPLYTEIPIMMLQPLVENAIEHGLMPSERKDKKLEFKCYVDDDRVVIKISDNGIGFREELISNKGSLALRNIKNRVGVLVENGEMNISFEIKSNPSNLSNWAEGTCALLTIDTRENTD